MRKKGKIFCILLNPALDLIYEVPGFLVGGTFKATSRMSFPVGKALSVALGLSLFGDSPSLVAFVGERELQTYKKFLNDRKISSILIPVKGKTRTNLTITDPITHVSTHIREAGFKLNSENFSNLISILETSLIPREDIVVIAGSVPPGLGDHVYRDLVKFLKRRNVFTFVDTSGMPLVLLMNETRPDFLKVNISEFNYLIGLNDDGNEYPESHLNINQLDLDAIARKMISFLNEDLHYFAVTLGEYGSILVNETSAFHSQLVMVEKVDTVGAGDAFHAGLVHKLRSNSPIQKMIESATAAASASILVHGAGMFRMADFYNYLKKVEVNQLL
ncbi:MAG: 1-phosphofructokinase family hexose kinase [Promethearchaeota archaeon]